MNGYLFTAAVSCLTSMATTLVYLGWRSWHVRPRRMNPDQIRRLFPPHAMANAMGAGPLVNTDALRREVERRREESGPDAREHPLP